MKRLSSMSRERRTQIGRFMEKVGPFTALVVLAVIFTLVNPRFILPMNLVNVIRQAAIYIILAVGMTFVITGAGIDLSIGSMLAVCTCVAGALLKDYGWPLVPVIFLTLGLGTGIGLINGLIITRLFLPPFIATLGMMVALRGVALVHSSGRIYHAFPTSLLTLGRGMIFGVLPAPIAIAFAVVFIGYILFAWTEFGRYCMAIGGNKEATRLAGVNIYRFETLNYALMGFLTAFAGIVLMGRIDSAQAIIGTNMEIHTIAAVIIGGTSLFGGRGSIGGSVIGAVILAVIANGLILAGVSFFWQQVVTGLIIILAVTLSIFRERYFYV
ncbi:sugar ABC transporter permease [Candidatus Aerophobetes bacterium Ae_b3b]|nr:MAG: sugar ABC transporter permease [Candidatus Aerophobetes bacterium Ae_b3b]